VISGDNARARSDGASLKVQENILQSKLCAEETERLWPQRTKLLL